MPESTSLAVNATTTMKVTAMFQNDTEVTSSINEEQTISIAINAVQDDGSGGFTPTPAKFTGTIYRWNTNTLYNGLTMNGPAEFYYNPSNYSSAQEAFEAGFWNVYKEKPSYGDTWQSGTVTLSAGEYTTDASTLNKTYYLKHDVVDDIITASYVCFVYNNSEHCLKGGDNGASFAANTQIIQDYQTFYNLGTYSNGIGCYFDSSDSYCYGGGFDRVSASSGGHVYVTGSSSRSCSVNSTDSSNCNQ